MISYDPTYNFEPLQPLAQRKKRCTSPEIRTAYAESSNTTAILFNRAAIQHIAKMGFYISQGKACDVSIDRKMNALRIRLFENGSFKFSRHNNTQTRLASAYLTSIPHNTWFIAKVHQMDLILVPETRIQ